MSDFTFKIKPETLDAITSTLEMLQAYAASELAPRNAFSPRLVTLNLMAADALELIDRDETAA